MITVHLNSIKAESLQEEHNASHEWFGASVKHHDIFKPYLKETSAFLLENVYKQKIVIFKEGWNLPILGTSIALLPFLF